MKDHQYESDDTLTYEMFEEHGKGRIIGQLIILLILALVGLGLWLVFA